MTKSESAHITAQTVLLESAEQVLQLRSAAGVRLAIPDTNNLIMVGTADWIAANVPGVEVVAEGEQPAIGKLLDAFSALPVLWGLNEPGALVRHSDVFKLLVTAGKTYLAATTPATPFSNDVRECLQDLISHHGDFTKACGTQKRESGASSGPNIASYWDHQLRTLDRMKAQAERALAATTQASTAQAEREKLLRAALDAAEKWANAEHIHARNIGRGGPGLLKDSLKAEEKARKAITALVATSTTDTQPPRTKAQIIALANASGIDTDDEGDIFGSTNGAIFAFVEALGVRAAAEVRDADRINWSISNPGWSTRWRIKNGAGQWQMVDDGESWGQWGEYRAVLDAAIRAFPLRSAGDTGGAA